MNQNNYLAHYGVMGMKWGIRRYQNKDGTLTDEGKKRVAKLKNKSDKHADKAYAEYSESYRLAKMSKRKNDRSAWLSDNRMALGYREQTMSEYYQNKLKKLGVDPDSKAVDHMKKKTNNSWKRIFKASRTRHKVP